jgi:erythromycin esterase
MYAFKAAFFCIFVIAQENKTTMFKKTILIIATFLLIVNCCFGNTDESARLVSYIESRAKPMEKSSDLDEIINACEGSKLVLLGEASHGTHEYYAWRDSISRRLISEHGFNFIAVEGDWASIYELNRYVKNLPGAASSAKEVLEKLDRWPQWMWGNKEVEALAERLRGYNDNLPYSKKVGFYGMDVYDEWRSKEVLLSYVERKAPHLLEQIMLNYSCIGPFKPDSWLYARAAALGETNCIEELKNVVDLLAMEREKIEVDDYDYFYAMQNALVVKHAEKFYRKAVSSRDASSWNSRVRYMHLTVSRLLYLYGENSKGIVWAHNTHIGDARFTEMSNWKQENIGHLFRVELGPENVFLIGFGTYEGTVKAGSQWGSRMQTMKIPKAAAGSFEEILSKVSQNRFFLIFNDEDRRNEDFVAPRGNRAVGVVYNPRNDHHQNYVLTILPLRYDVFLFFKETKALNPF